VVGVIVVLSGGRGSVAWRVGAASRVCGVLALASVVLGPAGQAMAEATVVETGVRGSVR